MKHRDQILQLHSEGKSRPEICRILQCHKSTVSYHLTPGQKEKFLERNNRYRGAAPILRKFERFKRPSEVSEKQAVRYEQTLYRKIREFSKDRKTSTMKDKPTFTNQEAMEKISANPVCYLTGTPIDLSKSSTYSLDHMIPRSRGGTNSLENMGLCTATANQAKFNLTVEEFHALCKSVVAHLS